ncbi:phage tail length tape measure family protein [Brevundimonas sp. CEF1]|uniref:phage tail length tape measure family protein n=1 Tax=Brevundimonas sp. CEF1 TaxID=3442642 RepID=UPI003F5151BC
MRRFATAAQATQARRAGRAAADKAAEEAAAAYAKATAEATKFGRQLKQIENWSWSSEVVEAPEQLAENFERAREEARRTKIELDNARAGVSRFSQAGGGLAAFEAKLANIGGEARRTDGAIDNMRTGVDQLTAAQRNAVGQGNRLVDVMHRQAAAARSAGSASRRDAGLAGKVTDAYATRNQRGPLGLRPYEMQNLGYQVNDLVTQIGSGTPVMQAFAQQGGQIAQLFPKATMTILRMAPAIALVAAAVAPFISAMNKANNEAARLSAMETLLKRSGNAASYTAPQLARVANEMQGLDVKADEANAAVSLFVQKAVDPAYLDRFAKATVDTAKVLKIDMADAAEKVTTAFTGNADAVMALDDEVGFLTESERKHIEKLKESKKDAEARTYAFEIFAKKYGAISDDMDGPWKRTLENLKNAWGGFVDFVNFIDWSKLKGELNWIASKLAEITSALPGARSASVDVVNDDVSKAYARVAQNSATEARLRAQGNRLGADQVARSIQQDRGVIALGETRLAGMSLINGTSELTRPRTAADTTTRPPANANTSSPKADRSGADDTRRKADEQAKFVASLLEENDARAFQISLMDETERRQLVMKAMRDAELGAAAVGLELTQAQRDTIEEGVTRLYDEGKAREAIKIIDQARLDLATAKGEIETRDAFIQRKLTEDLAGATEDQRATYAQILGQNYDLEASKRRQKELEEGVTALEQQRAELQRQILFAQETGDTAGAASLQIQLEGVNTALLTAIQRMREFWIATGGPEAQAALLALDGVERRIKGTGGTAIVTGKQINDAFAGTATSALDQFAQNLVDTGNLFGSLRDAFLQFAADFLRQIANMIMQQVILNMVGGGSAGGGQGGLGGFIAGLVSAPTKHTGGPVNSGGGLRTVGPWDFVGAMRYHAGGIAGLAPDEVPAILLRNEEVLTEDDPRHRANGGLGGGGGSVKVTNVFDPGDMLDKALSTEAGERTFLNFVGRNSGAFKAAIG